MDRHRLAAGRRRGLCLAVAARPSPPRSVALDRGAATGVVLTLLALYVVNTVNIALVRADTIYKQGQQFDAQRNWISSVELYRRALDARRTEDHYMLFLGRALLEQAKQAPAEGAVPLPAGRRPGRRA